MLQVQAKLNSMITELQAANLRLEVLNSIKEQSVRDQDTITQLELQRD